MNKCTTWRISVVVAIMVMVNNSLAATLPHKPNYYRSTHIARSPLSHGTSQDSSLDQQWSSGLGDEISRNVPFQETSDGVPFQDNDRSVYDPGVVDPNTIRSSSSAFIDALSETLFTDDDDNPVNRRHQHDSTPALISASAPVADDVDGPTAAIGNDDALLDNHENLLSTLRDEIKEDEEIAAKSAVLLKLLESTANGEPMPLVYVEEIPSEASDEISESPDKRSGRYYRRYSYKRQQPTRFRAYESEQRFMCVPNRDDVFKLLMGLHDHRKGNHQRSINFCNRKRPAKQVFTNIRFVG